MFFIPTWITNVLLLINCWLAGFQLVQLRRPNPLRVIQFWMIAFSLLMMAVVTLNNRKNAWLSLIFLLIAVFNISLSIRQHRMLPPLRKFE
jgi:hypothetical protein